MMGFWNRFSRRQWVTLFVFAVADFCSAVCISLQAPFYPAEAERKGATATEYGLVFGVFELTVFFVSPILGKNLGKYGAKRVFNIGILTTGTCSILFGLLDRIENGSAFIGLSFVVRAVEAVGNSGFLTASFSIIAKEFPDNVATMFASLETFFGIGLIVGPSVGGALYQLGGYTLPFAALGTLLICAAGMTHFVLPSRYDQDNQTEANSRDEKKGMIDALKIPSIALAAYSILCASISIGFIQATLEPHLRQFHLSPVMMGVMFVVNGGVYALTAPLWGYMCDKRVMEPITVTAIGALFITACFLFIGPVPFIPMHTIYNVCIGMLVLHGIGFAAELVSGFAIAHREAISNGFPDNLNTYALVSGLWTATFALGAFIGPCVAGLLVDHFQFRTATIFVVATQISLFVSTAAFICKTRRQKRLQKQGYIEIENANENNDYGSTMRRRSPSIGYDSLSSSSNNSPINGNGSPTDSGSFTDVCAEDLKNSAKRQQKLNVPINSAKRQQQEKLVNIPINSGKRQQQQQLNIPISADRNTNIFSPLSSPGAVSLLGGVMGINVPAMEVEEEDEHHHRPPQRRQEQHNKEPQETRIVVTAIVEDNRPQNPHTTNIC